MKASPKNVLRAVIIKEEKLVRVDFHKHASHSHENEAAQQGEGNTEHKVRKHNSQRVGKMDMDGFGGVKQQEEAVEVILEATNEVAQRQLRPQRPMSELEDPDCEFTWFELFESMAAKEDTFHEDRPHQPIVLHSLKPNRQPK